MTARVVDEAHTACRARKPQDVASKFRRTAPVFARGCQPRRFVILPTAFGPPACRPQGPSLARFAGRT